MHRISRIVELLVQVHSPPGYVHLLWARSCSCLPAAQSLLRADSMLVYRYSSMTLHGGKQSAEVLEKHSSCKSLSGSTILQNVSLRWSWPARLLVVSRGALSYLGSMSPLAYPANLT